MASAQLILASQSPRRRELLDQLGIHYQPVIAGIDESMHVGEQALEYVVRLAHEKAIAAGGDLTLPVLGADTIVVIDGQVLGKPGSVEQAHGMLSALSGRTHEVITAVALIAGPGKCLQAINTTTVEFKELSTEEIESYCRSGEPMDKAGGYGIQGRAAVFIRRIEGSYSAVMGLPLFETAELLTAAGIKISWA
jgi:septum formation protein